MLSITKGSIERTHLWDCLRKEGNFHLFKKENKIIPVHRPLTKETKNAKTFDDFAICESCRGVFKKKTLYRRAPGRVTGVKKN